MDSANSQNIRTDSNPSRSQYYKATPQSHPHKDADSPSSINIGSQSRSKVASRISHQWSAGLHPSGHHRAAEEPFVPKDPFLGLSSSSLVENNHNIVEHGTPGHVCSTCTPTSSAKAFPRNACIFMSDILPRLIYLNILLQLPSMYFSRVSKGFQDAKVSRQDIQRMIDISKGNGAFMVLSTSELPNFSTPDSNDVHNITVYPPGTLSPGTGIGSTGHVGAAASSGHAWTPPFESLAIIRFKAFWEALIDPLVQEWKALNVVSALLISGILTMLQIPSAEEDPVTRTSALLSLVCAVMSLIYGCMYIVRFGSMRSIHPKWAEEACKTDTRIWWNMWVLLAMPSVWMSWSMILFIVSILSFLWRTGSVSDPLSSRAALGPRIAITLVFSVGMVYFVLIVKTLRGYGTHATGMRAHVHAGGVTHERQVRDVETAIDSREQERNGVSRRRGA